MQADRALNMYTQNFIFPLTVRSLPLGFVVHDPQRRHFEQQIEEVTFGLCTKVIPKVRLDFCDNVKRETEREVPYAP
jgi:hypothetical protein